MRIILQILFSIFFVQCFTPSLAFVNNISITTDERVIQSTIYQDNTILLRLVPSLPPGSNCLENQIHLKLIRPNGTISDLTFKDESILPENFCFPQTNSQFITPPPLNQQVDGNGTLPISSLEEGGGVGGIILDGIRIYALQPGLILLTYFCKLETNSNVAERCGMLATWDNEMRREISFGQTCTDSDLVIQSLIGDGEGGGEFLRACYLSDQLLVNWTRYTIDDDGGITKKNSGIITNVIQFSPNVTEIFPTKDGGYGIVTAQYSRIEGSLFLPPWTLFLHFIPPLEPDNNVNISSSSQLYMQTTLSVISLNIYECGVSYQGYGYSCVMQFVRVSDDVLIFIDFSDAGGVLNTTEFKINRNESVIDVESLYYGGYLIMSQNSNIWIYNDNGTRFGNLEMPSTTDGRTPLTYTGIFGVFTNNTIWCVANSSNISDGVKLITNDLLTNYSTSPNNASILAYGNSFVNFTDPRINDTIQKDRSTISITFMNSVGLSTGNISIWQNGDDYQSEDTLRQFFSAQSEFVHLNHKTVSVDVFKSTFNIPGASYYVKVDNGFVKDLRFDQKLLGIRERRWSFRRELDTEQILSEPRSATVRLTSDGTKRYERLSKQNRSEFSRLLSEDLSRNIPCDLSRLNIKKGFQYNSRQILLLIIVKPSSLPGVDGSLSNARVISDLDSLIRNKSFTGIIRGDFSRMLDDEYGMIVIADLWVKYRWALMIGIGVGLLLLTILFWRARRQTREKSKGRNYGNYAIFVFTMIAVDWGLDIAFIISHGHDLKWLYPVSVTFLVIPILINVLFTYIIVARETRKQKSFLKWWNRNSKTALIFTLFSGIDVEALNIVSSGCAGFSELSAPLALKTLNRVLLVNGIVICLEDLPQLIIYSLYQKLTIVPAIIPILALSSCCTVLIVKSIGVMYFLLYPMCMMGKPEEPPKMVAVPYDKQEHKPPFTDGVKDKDSPAGSIIIPDDFGTGQGLFRRHEDIVTHDVNRKNVQIVNIDENQEVRTPLIVESTEPVEGTSKPTETTPPYVSKMIEKFDVEPGDDTDDAPINIQEEEPSSQPSTSKRIVGSLGRAFGGGSRDKKGKGSRDSKKGKHKEDDDKEQEREG